MAIVKGAYTTTELASLLGIAPKNVIARAKREGWISRLLQKRGGGYEWLLSSMPEKTRVAIAKAVAERLAAQSTENAPRIPGEVFTVNTLAAVPEKKRSRATARALLVSMAQEYVAGTGKTTTTAYEIFCHEYNRGAITVPEWVREEVSRFGASSLRNWEKALGNGGLAALTGKHGLHSLGTGIIDSTPGMADVVIAEIGKYYDVTAEEVLEALMVSHEGQRMPSPRSLQRWMKRYRNLNADTLLKLQNPDSYRSRKQAAFGSLSENIYLINQRWELDSSPADVLLADGKRYTLIGGIDVGTRRTRLHLCKTSNAQGVCALLRRMLVTFGVPETIVMDNGADYASFQVASVIHDLNILPHYCKPFSPEEKGHIERFFGTFQRRLKRLPGFIGHSVADRKAIEGQKSFAERISRNKGEEREKSLWELPFTPEEFQAYCDAFCNNVYGERKHRMLKMSPNEAAARAAVEGFTMRIADERALDILLMPMPGKNGIRTVQKHGIDADNGTYIAPRLGGIVGHQVQVRLDEDDAGHIYVFDLEGIFICRAEDSRLVGATKKEIANAAKAVQKAVEGEKVKKIKKIIAKVKPQDLMPLVAEMQQQRAEANREERELRYGAERSVEYTTPALEQAAIAAASREVSAPVSNLTDVERAAHTAKAERILADTPPPWSIPIKDSDKYIECRRLLAIEVVGGEMPFEAANWVRAWKNSKTFKTFDAVRIAGEMENPKIVDAIKV